MTQPRKRPLEALSDDGGDTDVDISDSGVAYSNNNSNKRQRPIYASCSQNDNKHNEDSTAVTRSSSSSSSSGGGGSGNNHGVCQLYNQLLDQYFETHKHVIDTRTIAPRILVDISTQQWPGFFWPDGTPVDAKINFLSIAGLLNSITEPAMIARYILTLVELNLPEYTAEVVEKLFTRNASQVDRTIRSNLEFCMMLKPEQLRDTPFERYNLQTYRQLIEQLGHYSQANVTWGLHMLTAKEDRASRREIMPLADRVIYALPPSDSSEVRNGIKKTAEQLLLDFLFARAGAQRMQRQEKQMFAPVYTKQDLFTRHYKLDSDMETWIRKQVDQQTYPKHYDTLTKKAGVIKYLMDHFNAQHDPRCPFRSVSRTLFSYENGIFCADKNVFYPYTTLGINFTHKLHNINSLESGIGTAQYFENTIVPLEWFQSPSLSWQNAIKCDSIEKVYRDQKYKTDEEMAWVQASHGRLVHALGRHDHWQVAVHTKGPPGCGKSVIAKTLQSWYPPEFIGVLNDDVEDGFPDQHLIGKLMIMCMDVSEQFGLTPTRFLCWVSGDNVNIKRKNLMAISLKWSAPVIFFSNYDPPVSAKGALRRFFIHPMECAIESSDGSLEQHAIDEAPLYLIKCTFAYHEKFTQLGEAGLWDVFDAVPERFWKAKHEFAEASSWPDYFLRSGRLTFGEGYSMTVEDFDREYRFFQVDVKRLRGVNNSHRSRESRNAENAPKCTQMEFTNALKSIREAPCRWNAELGLITGLKAAPKFNDDEKQPEASQQKRYNKSNNNNNNNNMAHQTQNNTQNNNTYTRPQPQPVIDKHSHGIEPATAAIYSSRTFGTPTSSQNGTATVS